MLQPMLNSLVSKMVPFVESQGGAEFQRKAGRKTWVQSGRIGGSHHLHELSYSPNDWGGSVLRTDHWDNKIHPPSIGSTHVLLSTYPSDDHPAHWNIMHSCIVINHHSYQHHSY